MTRKHFSGLGNGTTGRTPTPGVMATGRTWVSPLGVGAAAHLGFRVGAPTKAEMPNLPHVQ